MKIFTCIVCGSHSYTQKYLVSGKKIVRCEECHLLQTKNFKKPNYQNYHRDQSYQKSEFFLRFFFEKRYEIMKPYLINKGTVLEIGCSTGAFLDVLRNDGWKTWGVEPSGSSKIAIAKGHHIVKSSFEKSNLQKNKFDLIIANHVLEHIVSPVKFLNEIHRILSPKGLLFIDVPNAGSLSSIIQKSHWPYFLPEEHVSHFTKESLNMILNKANFKLTYSKSKSGIFEVSNPAFYLFRELTSLKKNFFIDIAKIPENVISEILDKGNSISVIAHKK